MKDLKLKIELVPSGSWGANIRMLMSKEQWYNIRRKEVIRAGYRCEICGISMEKGLHMHEEWEYDDINKIQKFKRFIMLCPNCHMIKHLGFAEVLANKGELDYSTLVKHYMNVNNCTDEDFLRHKDEAFKKWNERSKYTWTIDLGEELGSMLGVRYLKGNGSYFKDKPL